MSVTLGSYNTLPNPVKSRKSQVAPGVVLTMADGSERRQVFTTRYVWEYEWVARSTDLTNVRAAIAAAITAEKTFKPWDEAGTYTVAVDGASVTDEPEGVTSDGAYRVGCSIRELTA